MNKVKSCLPATRGEMLDYFLGDYADGNSQDPAYRKTDHFLGALRSGTIPEGDVFTMLRSGLLGIAEYNAICDGYSGDIVASEGVRSDRKRIVSEARYLREDIRRKDAEMQDRLNIEGWKEIRRKTKNGSGEGYNYNHALVEEQSGTDGFDGISYIGNANALSYINHLHRTANKSCSESETKNLRKLAELYNYLKGGFDDSAGIKTMNEIVNGIPGNTISQEEIDAIRETGLGEYEPFQFLNYATGQIKL